MKVRIVNYELGKDNWILGKFANKMYENLQGMGIDAELAAEPDARADINHHLIYYNYDCVKRGIDTLMITHIDNSEKLDMLRKQMTIADAGICMSKEAVQYLSRMGVNKDALCYINPAHDGRMPVRKTVIGLSSRVYDDGRKREIFLEKLAKVLHPNYFKFRIMGENWDRQVAVLKKCGFEVDYFSRFDYEEYVRFIPSLDYYLYMGMDEGQIGFIDALSAGVKTIVTKQGFHLDAEGGITHPFTSYEELEAIFLSLQNEVGNLVNAVASWNWHDYTKKHVEIWRYLLDNSNTKSEFPDGLNSLMNSKNTHLEIDREFVLQKQKELQRNQKKHFYFKKKHQFNKVYQAEGLSGIIKLIKKKLIH